MMIIYWDVNEAFHNQNTKFDFDLRPSSGIFEVNCTDGMPFINAMRLYLEACSSHCDKIIKSK